jgi:hypothetical protein
MTVDMAPSVVKELSSRLRNDSNVRAAYSHIVPRCSYELARSKMQHCDKVTHTPLVSHVMHACVRVPPRLSDTTLSSSITQNPRPRCLPTQQQHLPSTLLNEHASDKRSPVT